MGVFRWRGYLVYTWHGFVFMREVDRFMPKCKRLHAALFALAIVVAGPAGATPMKAQETEKPILAATPPMGWNSWNHFAGKVNDADVRAAADALVSSGMRDAGYIYVNIDDTWEGPRNARGEITTNSKFPDMKALADYVHSKGLKLGIYSSPGSEDVRGISGQLRA
jgi:Alpha galactosidase A